MFKENVRPEEIINYETITQNAIKKLNEQLNVFKENLNNEKLNYFPSKGVILALEGEYSEEVINKIKEYFEELGWKVRKLEEDRIGSFIQTCFLFDFK